jgi:acetyl esterase/lipase
VHKTSLYSPFAGIAYLLLVSFAAPAPATDPPIAPTLSDVSYGTHAKHVLHFWQAKSDQPAPLLFFIHGGGWITGDRMSGLDYALLKPMLDNGISVVSVEYRFLKESIKDGVSPPVKGCLYDAARALQFVRGMASEWNIDKQRVIASGNSAGSCTSLWLAFHDDLANPQSDDPIARESTRLWAAAVTGAQTTLDPLQMREWTPNSYYGSHAFGIYKSINGEPPVLDVGKFAFDIDTWLARRDELLPLINEYSPYALATADDPPIYLHYTASPALGQPQKDPTHSASMGVKLQERLRALNVACELVYPDASDVKHLSVADYVLATLKSVSTK